MMALWRIVERESGSIKIDGLDTLTIGLQDLRTALALVPQVCCCAACMPLPRAFRFHTSVACHSTHA